MSVFAKRLKEARLQAGISQEKLGVNAGVDEASASARMNQYERGKHVPDISMVERLAKVLGVPVTFFYSSDEEEAKLLCEFHRMSKNDRQRLLTFIENGNKENQM